MKLYITLNSPFARMARIVVLEKNLQARVELVEAKTRTPDSPYYAINPSGRVPYLVRDDGVGMEESALICDYLDSLDGRPTLEVPADWETRRMSGVWEREIGHPAMHGPLNLLQILVGCTLGLEARNRGFDWRSGHPKLEAWYAPIAARPSFRATEPPGFPWERAKG